MQYFVLQSASHLTKTNTEEKIPLVKNPDFYEHKNIRSFLNVEYENIDQNIEAPAKPKPLRSSYDLKFDQPYSSFDFRRYRNRNSLYNLKNASLIYSSQIMQDQILLNLLDTPDLNRRNASNRGIFLEAGAYDGETWSNTLHLERFKNWTGLLIEPSVENYHKLRSKNRHAYSVNNCLCKGEVSINSTYIEAGPFGITTNGSKASGSKSVTCHPLGKILEVFFRRYFPNKVSVISGRNRKHVVDYMSLDIEGYEHDIVKTFPWSKFQVNLMNIEYNQDRAAYGWLKNYLRKFGYYETLVDDVWYQDLYLAHKSVFDKLNLSVRKVSEFMRL